jgi:exosortase
MTPAATNAPATRTWWPTAAWFGFLLLICYAPILRALIYAWIHNEDMGHGFFVPLVAGYVVWQQRDELVMLKAEPSWWGLGMVLTGALLLVVATLGAEVFLARLSFVVTLTGSVWMLGGRPFLYKLRFPLFLLLFMMPIPSVIYTRITFPLQLIASRLAENALTAFSIPVLREGNVLELPSQRLDVVEACSGIRSLLSLTFLALVYGHFFEKKNWIRTALFFSTVPVAILANAGRVTLTGLLSLLNPKFTEGAVHETMGMVTFLLALGILIAIHRALVRIGGFQARRRIGELPA